MKNISSLVWFFTCPQTDASARNRSAAATETHSECVICAGWADKNTLHVRECLSPRTSQVGSGRFPKSRRSEGKPEAEKCWWFKPEGASIQGGLNLKFISNPFRLLENRINVEAD